LEEPPSHVKFILATTEAQKVPATIVSRCQRFDFKAINTDAMAAHLARIAAAERVQADDGVLRRVARLANGSMRDALSLLDQLLSYDPQHLTSAIVNEVLPPPHDELSAAVIGCVADRDAAGALRALDTALQTGRTVDRFCDHLIEHVRTLMLLRVCGPDTDLVDVAATMRTMLISQADKFDAPTYVYMIALLEELRRNVKFSGAARALADAAVVRLAMSHQFTDLGVLLGRLEGNEAGAAAPPDAKKTAAPDPAARRGPPPIAPASGRSAPAPPTQRRTPEEWERAARDPLVQRVKAAVDGTLLDIRPAQPAGANAAPPAEVAEEGEPTLFATEE
jgi:DNA polymerase-3 subunit gamma/tau